MHHRRSKNILFYFFLFLIIGTLNNKNFNNPDFPKINEINISGLDKKSSYDLQEKLKFLMIHNLFSLNKFEVEKIINMNNLVENFSVIKKYPSSLKIEIKKTKFLAYVKQNDDTFFFGSNGRLINTNEMSQTLPLIFGKFENKDFFKLKEVIDEVNFEYKDIKNLFFFKSGRWDIETFSGVMIKLPKSDTDQSLKLVLQILKDNQFRNIKLIDLRQKKQIIINE